MGALGGSDAKRRWPGLLACGIAMLLGALAVQTLPVLPPRWFAGALLIAALLVLAAAAASKAAILSGSKPDRRCVGARQDEASTRRPLRRSTGAIWFAIGIAAFGYTCLRADTAMHMRLPHALEGRDVEAVGSIDDLPQAQPGSTRFQFDVESATLDGARIPLQGLIRLSWYDSSSGIAPMLTPCSRWRLQVRLKRPRGLINPGGMDFERTALQQRINATGYVREGPGNTQLSRAFCVDALRARLSNAIAAALPDDLHAAHLLRALSVGDQRALSDADWRVVRATGVSHLIAISGFHVGLAAVFGALLARGLWWLFPGLGLRLPRPIAEACAALPAACFYGALAGFGLPTTRTLWMIGAVSAARIARRGGGIGEGLGLALCAILLVDPLAVLSAGFWLSFAGVGFLVWTLARGEGWRGHLREIGLAPLLMTLALLPLTIWFFGQASVVGPIANLIAVPFISFVIVPLTLLASLFLLPLPVIGVPMLHVCAWLADAQWWLLAQLAGWPAAMYYMPEPSPAAFGLACLGAIWLLAPRGLPARALGALLFLPLLWPRLPVPRVGGFSAMVTDVGQGLSVLVRTRHHALLFDTGARYPSGFDLGEAAVVPSLHALGVNRLDALIVSHGDNDHAGGAVAVHAAYPHALAFGGEPARGPIPLRQCFAGQHWQWDGVAFRILSPHAPVNVRGNDAGCVLLVTGAAGRLLLPADTTSKIEPSIATAAGSGAPLVLVAPHHGSRTSSSAPYLRALAPVMAIASAGYRNRFHHPAAAVVARYGALGIPLVATFDTGAVRVDFPPAASPRIIAEERNVQARYWREH